MAEVTRRRTGELVRGVFKILIANPEGLPVKVLLGQLERIVPPTEFENTPYPNHPNVRRYERIVRFSTIGPVKAGWLLKNKGLWSITDEGKKAFEKFPDPEKFKRESDRLYRQWAEKQPIEEVEEPDEKAAEVAITIEEAEESAWSEIEEHLSGMNPYDFQNLVAGLLRGMGYSVSWVAPAGPDKGIDIIAHSDPLGIQGPRIKVQVKRQAQKIDVLGLRSFMALVGDVDVGLFVSMGGFTRDAEDETRSQQGRRIMLVDLRRLFDLWVEHYDHIPETYRRTFALKPVYFLAPEE